MLHSSPIFCFLHEDIFRHSEYISADILYYTRVWDVQVLHKYVHAQYVTLWPDSQNGKGLGSGLQLRVLSGQAKVRELGQLGAQGMGHGSHDWPQDTPGMEIFHSPAGNPALFFIFSSVQRFLQGFWRLIFQEWTPSSGNYFVSFIVFQPTGRISSVFH